MKVGFIGAGNMAEAIIAGMIKSGFSPENIIILETNKDRIVDIRSRYDVLTDEDDNFFDFAEIIILSVKPQVIKSVLKEYNEMINKDHLLISIAAGITLENLAELTKTKKIIRVMPNTPALISMGISAITTNSSSITDIDRKNVETIIESVGEYVWLEESQMNAVTALSGSGPAYIYRFADAMIDSGVLIGLPRDLSRQLVIQTMLGSTMMMKTTGKSPKDLEYQVTSPGGTTIHGLESMEKSNFSSAVKDGVKSAYLRAIELGKENK